MCAGIPPPGLGLGAVGGNVVTLSDADRLEADLLAVELAQACFLDYAEYVYVGYPGWARHLALLAEYLEEVERYVTSGGAEGIGRLMVNMPPRHWKSTTVSVLFPGWFLGRNPDKRVIVTSYNGSLAMGFSRRTRNDIQGDEYRAVFGDRSGRVEVRLSDDSRSVESWDLAGRRGGLMAAGIMGGVTGKGADLFIIDDPHKDRTEAESKTKREVVWDFYTATARTRVEKGGAMIVIQTRWHNDDLSGQLIKKMYEDADADQWTVLSLPAIAEEWAQEVEGEDVLRAARDGWWRGVDPLGREPGEVLCPELFDWDYFRPIKANSGYQWVALYMQRPRLLVGKLIKAGLIPIIDWEDVPDGVRPVRYWDLAVGRSKRAHWVAGAMCGRDRMKNFYIMDVVRFPAPWSEARPRMKRVMLEDPLEVVQGIEVAGQQDGYYQNFRDDADLQERSFVPVQVKGDKEGRAQLWGTRIEDKKVFIVRGPWVEGFVERAVSFPSEPDDEVDAVSGGWQMLPGFVGMADLPQDEGRRSRWAELETRGQGDGVTRGMGRLGDRVIGRQGGGGSRWRI